MKIVDHNQIIRLNMSPAQILNWVEQMLAEKDELILPPKSSMKWEGNVFFNTMPCIIPKYDIAGVKIVNRYPNRTPSLDSQILIYDLRNGKFKAIVDGNYITAMRTGAMAAYSVKLLAKTDFNAVGMIGLGNTARATLKIINEIYKERELVVKLYNYKNHARLFMDDFRNCEHIKFEVLDTYEEIVEGSDVIISCVTYTDGNFCEDQFYKEGCLVIPVHTRGFQNCDLFFDKVFADDKNHVSHFKNFNRFNEFAELSNVINKQALGRETNKERILAYNIGIAIHDIYLAKKICDQLPDDNNKYWLNQLNKTFWI